MDKRKKVIILCMTVILYCGMIGQQIFASTVNQDGLWVNLIGDKEAYGQNEQITATLTVTNMNSNAVTNVMLENFIPDGYKLAEDGDTVKNVKSLESGNSISLTITYVPDKPENDGGNSSGGGDTPAKPENNGGNSSGGEDTPVKPENNGGISSSGENMAAKPDQAKIGIRSLEFVNSEKTFPVTAYVSATSGQGSNVTTDKMKETGLDNQALDSLFDNRDQSNVDNVETGLENTDPKASAVNENSNTAWCILTLLFFGIVMAGISVGRKYRKRLLSLFLCAALVGGLTLDTDVNALAAEADGQRITISIAKHIVVGGNEVVLKANVLYDAIDEEEPDTDDDSVPDYIEEYFGTDSAKEDTDGDGLSDYMEIFVLSTDPMLKDTDGNGIEDGEEDADQDGLSNIDEVAYGTDPAKVDTDGDGLNDYEEVASYGTDPQVFDTDGDGISDGNEVLLGLDPLKQSTDGKIKDSERTFHQTLSLDLIDESLLSDGNEVKPSVMGEVSDNMNQHVYVESTDIYALHDNRSVVGNAVSVITDYDENSGLKLQFDCSNISERTEFLVICSYQNGEIIPCETTALDDTIACDAASGSYFVADAEKLLGGVGISLEAYTSAKPAAVYTLPDTGSNEVNEEWYKENYILMDKDGNPVVDKLDTVPSEVDEAKTAPSGDTPVGEPSTEADEAKTAPSGNTPVGEPSTEADEAKTVPSGNPPVKEPSSEADTGNTAPSGNPSVGEPSTEADEAKTALSGNTPVEKPSSEADQAKTDAAQNTTAEKAVSAGDELQAASSDGTSVEETVSPDHEQECIPATEMSANEPIENSSADVTMNELSEEGIPKVDSETGYYVLADSCQLAAVSNVAEGYERKDVSGQADIVFVIDSTGSMSSAINNVVKNIDTFVDTLAANYSVQANFALIDFKDITCGEETRLIKNGSSNWFTDVDAFKSCVGNIYVTGGGDDPETPIDGLAMAEELDFRQNADKFIILITDTYYKTDNYYGISSMEEMTAKLSSAGIVTSVISNTSYETNYNNLYHTTDGVFGDIYGDFYKVLLELADNIGNIVNDGTWVILSDFQYIKLKAPVSEESGMDTDGDGITDYVELGTPHTMDLTKLLEKVLEAYGIPLELYQGETSITTYKYVSNPVLVDSDFDGKNDGTDAVPLNNKFNGKLKTGYASSKVNFDMDYRWFFDDNTTYNKKLSAISLLYSSAIYHENALNIQDSLNMDTTNGDSMKEVMKYFGLNEAGTYALDELYSDNHLSEVGLGYRTLTYNGVTRTVLAVTIRGTNGTIEEWSSNFDLGNSSDFSSVADWTKENNHEGFDVASNRIMKLIEQYVSDNGLDTSDVSYWVTGHSRGAAIANIVGANLESDGKRAYTYTFAAPNTTMAEDASSYHSIFNIVNSDDFVPCLPMDAWGYTRYGRTASLSIASNYEKEWEALTGIWDYNPDTFGMQNTVSSLSGILSGDPRVECYKYTCSCHGDGSDDMITITNYGMSEKSREEAIEKIPGNALPYCMITRYNGGWISGWDFDACQTPSYFMQVLAAKMSGQISNYRFVVELSVADRYKTAKRAIISSAIGGLEHPHYTESYYVLSKNLSAAEFM